MMKATPIRTAAPALALVAAACGAAESRTPDAGPPTVETAPVVRMASGAPVTAAGALTERTRIPLSFKIGGVVDEVTVDDGESVERGQVLARLELDEIEARLDAAEAAVAKAERDVARAERLHADSVVTLEQLQNARTALDVAAAELRVARFDRTHAVITAPAPGRILARDLEPGEIVSAGRPVLFVGEAGWRFRAGLPDRDVVRVGLMDEATVELAAVPGRLAARVVEISGQAHPRTGTWPVELAVTDPEGHLRSGFVGRAEIRPSAAEAVLRVPVDALVSARGDRVVLYVVVDDATPRARRVEVPLVDFTDRGLLIPAGSLDGARRVVTRGAALLSDGTPVTVRGTER